MRRVDREQTRDFALQVLDDCTWVTQLEIGRASCRERV